MCTFIAEWGCLSSKYSPSDNHNPSGIWCAKGLLYTIFVVEHQIWACGFLFYSKTAFYVSKNLPLWANIRDKISLEYFNWWILRI